MKIRFWSFLVLIIALSSCSTHVPIEIELYTSLKIEFKNSDVDLEKKLIEYESMLLDKKVLKNTSWKARKAYLEFAAKNDTFAQVQIDSGFIEFVTLQNQLSLKALEKTIHKFDKYHKEEFDKSKFKAILDQVDAAPIETRNRPKTIAKAVLDNLTDDDYKDPFYKALVLIVIANSNDVYMQSLDSVIDYSKLPRSHPVFKQGTMCFYIPPPSIISINNNQILFRGHPFKHLDSLSYKIIEYYTFNRNLTKAETLHHRSVSSSKNKSFPFYFTFNLLEKQEIFERAQAKYIDAINNNNTSKEFIEFKLQNRYEWAKIVRLFSLHHKKKTNQFYDDVPFIINRMNNNKTLFNNRIWIEIYSAFYKLRKDECQTVFKQSYQRLKTRSNFFYNDILKLRLIETLFPMNIIVNYHLVRPSPPQLVEEIKT